MFHIVPKSFIARLPLLLLFCCAQAIAFPDTCLAEWRSYHDYVKTSWPARSWGSLDEIYYQEFGQNMSPAVKREMIELNIRNMNYAMAQGFQHIQNKREAYAESLRVQALICSSQAAYTARYGRPYSADSRPSNNNVPAAPSQQNTANVQAEAEKIIDAYKNARYLAETKYVPRDEKRIKREEDRVNYIEFTADRCLKIKTDGLFGAFTNTCNYEVRYDYCLINPKPGSWGEQTLNCNNYIDDRPRAAGLTIGPKKTQAQHLNNSESQIWVACKAPYLPFDILFDPSKQELSYRCRKF